MIAHAESDDRHVLQILRRSMLDPALSGGCPLLAEIFGVIAEKEVAEPLLQATPAWRIPGLLLSEVRTLAGGASLGPSDAPLELPIELRGAPLDLGALHGPAIERAIGVDLDPPDLNDPARRAWMRACQFPLTAEWAWFDRAIDLVLERAPRIERGSATEWLPRLAAAMAADQPLIVTDTYVAVFMSEDEREALRCELDAIARLRPVVWISNDPVVPLGNDPDRTTAGVAIPHELVERNRNEMFGAVCATTWPAGKRTGRIVGITHPGGCWLEWWPT